MPEFEAEWIEWARIALVCDGPDAAVEVLGWYLALNGIAA